MKSMKKVPTRLLTAALSLCLMAVLLPGAKAQPAAASPADALSLVSSAKSPASADGLKLKWSRTTITDPANSWNDIPGTPVEYGGYVYYCSSQYLWKLDAKTGAVAAKALIFTQPTDQFYRFVAYGDGKIFVPCDTDNAGKTCFIRAFDAATLTQLYVTAPICSAAYSFANCPIQYHDGYIFTGASAGLNSSWAAINGTFACFDASDSDTAKTDEVKTAKWTINSPNGFYLNGAAFSGDMCYFCDNGADGIGNIYSVNYKTGFQPTPPVILPGYICKASPAVEGGRIYVSACVSGSGMSVMSFALNEDVIDPTTRKEYLSGVAGGGTASTPVIYGGRLYISGTGKDCFRVLDASSLTQIYSIDALHSSGSASLTTAYASQGGKVTVYMAPFDSSAAGSAQLYIISDAPGQTTAKFETAAGLVIPQYCSQSVAVDEYGDLIWYNDAGYLYCCGVDADTSSGGSSSSASTSSSSSSGSSAAESNPKTGSGSGAVPMAACAAVSVTLLFVSLSGRRRKD